MSKIKCFFDWLKPDNDFFTIIKPLAVKPDTIKHDYVTVEDVKAIISICEHSRNRALIMLLWNTGACINELLTTKVGDVDLENAEITVEGKTGRCNIPITTMFETFRGMESSLRYAGCLYQH